MPEPTAAEFAASAIEHDRLAQGHLHLANEAGLLGMYEERTRQMALARQHDRDADHCRYVVAFHEVNESESTPV